MRAEKEIRRHVIPTNFFMREILKIHRKKWFKLRHPSWYFENVIMVMIILSSLMLIIDSPLNDPNSTFSRILGIVDAIFTVIFTIEAIIKIIALGFFTSSGILKSYLQNGWNVLDFVVVIISLYDLSSMYHGVGASGNLKSLKALRAFRALRPLRMISRSAEMRLVVNALFASIPSMTNVLIVCLLFTTIFAITGINFF